VDGHERAAAPADTVISMRHVTAIGFVLFALIVDTLASSQTPPPAVRVDNVRSTLQSGGVIEVT